jgi:hypothetical protein
VPNTAVIDGVKALGIPVHTIGGTRLASELDAKRAIQEGHELAMTL